MRQEAAAFRRAVFHDHDDRIVRRLEQKRGACIDAGSITFFEGDPRQRPAVFHWPLVDIDPVTGVETILHPDYHQSLRNFASTSSW